MDGILLFALIICVIWKGFLLGKCNRGDRDTVKMDGGQHCYTHDTHCPDVHTLVMELAEMKAIVNKLYAESREQKKLLSCVHHIVNSNRNFIEKLFEKDAVCKCSGKVPVEHEDEDSMEPSMIAEDMRAGEEQEDELGELHCQLNASSENRCYSKSVEKKTVKGSEHECEFPDNEGEDEFNTDMYKDSDRDDVNTYEDRCGSEEEGEILDTLPILELMDMNAEFDRFEHTTVETDYKVHDGMEKCNQSEVAVGDHTAHDAEPTPVRKKRRKKNKKTVIVVQEKIQPKTAAAFSSQTIIQRATVKKKEPRESEDKSSDDETAEDMRLKLHCCCNCVKQPKEFEVFLYCCELHSDAQIRGTDWLAKKLCDHGCKIFTKNHFKLGQSIFEAIEDGMKSSRMLLVPLWKECFTSNTCAWSFYVFDAGFSKMIEDPGLRVLPILSDDVDFECIEQHAALQSYVDTKVYYKGPIEQCLPKIIQAL